MASFSSRSFPSAPARKPPHRADLRSAVALGGAVGALTWLAIHLAFFTALPLAAWLPGAILLLVAFAALARLIQVHYPHDALGLCNGVTMTRGAMALSLITPLVAGGMPGWTVFAIATVAVSLDGVDGFLARRSGLASAFGARFDMEVDAALSLILAVLALTAEEAGPAVLILGATRYVFVAATWVFPWLAAPLPERFSRKAICVLQLSVLIALQAPVISPSAGTVLTWLASAALLASFGRDILWLRSRKG